jgi:ABC-2 type transport system permease protein
MSSSALRAESRGPSFASRIFALFGVDEIQFRTLLRIGFLIDLRGSAQAATPGHATDSPLKSSMILYGVCSAFLAPLAFLFPAALYARFIMVFGMALLGMIMLVDFGVTLVVPDDIAILGWRPISSRTYFAAKLTNALAFICAFAVALFTVPAIAGIFARGATVMFFPVFLLSAIFGGVFIAGLVAASYAALLRIFSAEKFRSAVNFLQIAMMATLMVGSQVGPRIEGRDAMRQLLNKQGLDSSSWSWWDLMPPRWFCAPGELLIGGANRRVITLSAIAFVGTIALFIVLIRSLSLTYLQKVHGSGATSPVQTPGRRRSWFLPLFQVFFRTSEESVMFHLIRTQVGRDRQVRLRIYPMLAYALIVLPFVLLAPASRGHEHVNPGLLKIAPLIVMGLLPGVLLPLLPFAGESQGAWIFELAGLQDTGSVASGIKKSLACLFLIPLALACFAGLVFVAGPWQAALSISFALSVAILILQLEFMWLFSGLPFTRKMPKGRASANLTYVFIGYGFIAVAGALAYFILNTPLRLLIATAVILAAAAALNHLGNKSYQPFGVPLLADADDPVKLFQ